MFASVIQAPVTFFDANPVGRVLNRFSKDIGMSLCIECLGCPRCVVTSIWLRASAGGVKELVVCADSKLLRVQALWMIHCHGRSSTSYKHCS
jgi:hypothetical protein